MYLQLWKEGSDMGQFMRKIGTDLIPNLTTIVKNGYFNFASRHSSR